MTGDRVRDNRQTTRLSVCLNIDGQWQDATITNVSAKGLMVKCPTPPARGAYVEMRRGENIVIAQVRWSDGPCFGALSQMPIDLPRLRSDAQNRTRKSAELRGTPRIAAVAAPSPEQRADASRRLARTIEFASLFAVLAVAALLIAHFAAGTLARPLQAAAAAMHAPD